MQNFKFFNILVNLNFIINTSYVWYGLNTLKLWVENLQICETKPGSLWSSQSWGEHYWTGIWTSKLFAPNWILITSLEMSTSNYKIWREIHKPEDSGIHSYLGPLSEKRNKCFRGLYKVQYKILSFCFFHLSLLELPYFPGVCELRKPFHLIEQLSC